MFTENARSEFVYYDEELIRANRPEIWYDKQKGGAPRRRYDAKEQSSS